MCVIEGGGGLGGSRRLLLCRLGSLAEAAIAEHARMGSIRISRRPQAKKIWGLAPYHIDHGGSLLRLGPRESRVPRLT